MSHYQYDVVGFGEALIRFHPTHNQRIEQASSFDVYVGGPEINPCITLSRFGLRTGWVSKLVNNPLGRMIANKAREQGVDISRVIWTKEGRTAFYFLELGAKPRPSQIVYDRKETAASNLRSGEIDWSFLKNTKVLLVGGITPALSKSCEEAVIEAMRVAKDVGCLLAFDVNYRARLWTQEQAYRSMTSMMKYVDILFSTIEDTERVFYIQGTPEERCTQLREKYDLPIVCITIKDVRGVWSGAWSSVVCGKNGQTLHTPGKYELEVIDRVGAGDNFVAGFLYGYLTGAKENSLQRGMTYGDATAAFMHSIPGDFNWTTLEEIESVMKGEDVKIRR